MVSATLFKCYFPNFTNPRVIFIMRAARPWRRLPWGAETALSLAGPKAGLGGFGQPGLGAEVSACGWGVLGGGFEVASDPNQPAILWFICCCCRCVWPSVGFTVNILEPLKYWWCVINKMPLACLPEVWIRFGTCGRMRRSLDVAAQIGFFLSRF